MQKHTHTQTHTHRDSNEYPIVAFSKNATLINFVIVIVYILICQVMYTLYIQMFRIELKSILSVSQNELVYNIYREENGSIDLKHLHEDLDNP